MAFEVGNTVYASGRVSTVEKVHANGNFKIAGIEGQWRQHGYKAGSHGYHTPRVEHYTEELAEKIRTERTRQKLRGALFDMNDPVHANTARVFLGLP